MYVYTSKNITAGFSWTGIYPVNRNIFTGIDIASGYAKDRLNWTQPEEPTDEENQSHSERIDVKIPITNENTPFPLPGISSHGFKNNGTNGAITEISGLCLKRMFEGLQIEESGALLF